jgi:hypothetical protein
MIVLDDAIRAALAAHQRLASLPKRRHERLSAAGPVPRPWHPPEKRARGPGIELPGSRPPTSGSRVNKWGFRPNEQLRVTDGKHAGRVGEFRGMAKEDGVTLKPEGEERFETKARWCVRVK